MLKMASKMKTDIKYKTKIFCDPVTPKVKEFMTFLKDARRTLEKLKFAQDTKITDREIEQVESRLTLLEDRKIAPQAAKKSERGRSATPKKEPHKNVALFTEGKPLRCKSCACTACGGIKYYKRIGQKLLVLALRNNGSRSDEDFAVDMYVFFLLHF